MLWRTPIGPGFSGPAGAGGTVYVTDWIAPKPGQGPRGAERAIALDEKTGKVLWTQEWAADYARAKVAMHSEGPGATPTVDGDRLYVLGRSGLLVALSTRSGEIAWTHNYIKEYKAELDSWGSASAPIVVGDRVIALVGGEAGAKVIAWDTLTGKEAWRGLSFENMHGTAPLVAIEAGGTTQLIVWHPSALVSLNPRTGKVYWEQPFNAYLGTNPAAPVHSGDYLFISNFTFGTMMMTLDRRQPKATMHWKGKGTSKIDTDGLHSLISGPIIDGDHIYGICAYGQLRCLNAKTGERVWESQAVIERARYATAFIVRNGHRFFINNDAGQLIIAELTPAGYKEIDRTTLIKATTEPGSRRKNKFVNWSHPAYANRHIYARNDEEIICASLAADGR